MLWTREDMHMNEYNKQDIIQPNRKKAEVFLP